MRSNYLTTNPVNSGRFHRRHKSTVSETRKVASPQVSVVSHTKDSGCLDRTFTVSEAFLQKLLQSHLMGENLQQRTELTE